MLWDQGESDQGSNYDITNIIYISCRMHSPGMRNEKCVCVCARTHMSYRHYIVMFPALNTRSPSSQAHLLLSDCVKCINGCCYYIKSWSQVATEQSFSCIDDLWLIKRLQMTLLLASSLSRDDTRFFYWTDRWAPRKVWSVPVLLKRTKNNKVFTVTWIKQLKWGQLSKMCHIY